MVKSSEKYRKNHSTMLPIKMAFRSLKAEEWTNKNPENPPKSIYPQAGTYTYNDYIFVYNVSNQWVSFKTGAFFWEFWGIVPKDAGKMFLRCCNLTRVAVAVRRSVHALRCWDRRSVIAGGPRSHHQVGPKISSVSSPKDPITFSDDDLGV